MTRTHVGKHHPSSTPSTRSEEFRATTEALNFKWSRIQVSYTSDNTPSATSSGDSRRQEDETVDLAFPAQVPEQGWTETIAHARVCDGVVLDLAPLEQDPQIPAKAQSETPSQAQDRDDKVLDLVLAEQDRVFLEESREIRG